MNINKLAPWNWFKKEQEQEGNRMPVMRRESQPGSTDSLMDIHRQIDRMFDGVYKHFGLPSMGWGRTGSPMSQLEWLKPQLDVGATDKEYTISIELPGVDQKDIQLELSGDTLKIKGEKRQEKEEKEKDYYRVERSYGSFQRVLSLPEDADQDGIEAAFKHGVMTVKVPRRSLPQSAAKQIDIKAE
jgi:HSP20 family protein